MSIRTSKNSKQQILSDRSPVRSLLESMLAAAMNWVARKKDKQTGKRIGNVTQVEDIIKYGKDSFSLHGRCGEKTISLIDIRGKFIFLRLLPSGQMDTADLFLFCLGRGKYILTDWGTVWRVLGKLNGRSIVIYADCWQLNKKSFLTLLEEMT